MERGNLVVTGKVGVKNAYIWTKRNTLAGLFKSV